MVLLLPEELWQLYAPSQFVSTFPITPPWKKDLRTRRLSGSAELKFGASVL